LTLKQGLLEKLRAPWPTDVLGEGVTDTLEVVRATLAETLDTAERTQPLRQRLAMLAPQVTQDSRDLHEWRLWLVRLRETLSELPPVPVADRGAATTKRLDVWTARLAAQIHDALAELDDLAPWVKLLDGPDAEGHGASLASGVEAA